MFQLSQIEPVADRVVIKRDDMPTMTKGGIYVPQTAKNNQNHGIVLKAGPKSSVKAGDRVYFMTNAHGMQIYLEGEPGKVFIMPELGVVAVK